MSTPEHRYTNTVRFQLIRDEDVTGVSGAGHVADGVLFTDGVAAMRWRRPPNSIGIYDSIEDLIAIHGHDGATRVEYLDTVRYPLFLRRRPTTEESPA